MDFDLATHGTLALILAGVGAFFMAFTIGGNDVANSFASAVGAKAISVRQAVLIAGLMNVLGAVVLGGYVADKLVRKIVEPAAYPSSEHYVLAMLAVLFAAAFFVLLSTLTGLPVSTTHAVVGAMVGVGVVAAGTENVAWPQLYQIVASWVVSPLGACLMAYLVLWAIQRYLIRDGGVALLERLVVYVPYIVAGTSGVLLFSLFRGEAVQNALPFSREGFSDIVGALILLAFVLPYVTLIAQPVMRHWIEKLKEEGEPQELVFRRLQVGTSSYVAFAQGANDVANAISPVFGIYLVWRAGGLAIDPRSTSVPFLILVLGGIGIAIGIGTIGYRVMRTLGERITKLNNTKGFSVDFSTATTVVLFSILGIPVSSTHAATGSVIGVGLREGWRAVRFSVFAQIIAAWLLTVPVAATVAVLLYSALKYFFLPAGLST